MKVKYLLYVFIVVIILPQLLFCIKPRAQQQFDEIIEKTSEAEMKDNILLVQDGSNILSLNFEDYIAGVVLAEMPADFEAEALKAQAVAARTYTVYHILKDSKHENAAVCTDATCCQAYNPAWISDESVKKVMDAVDETRSQVLTYSGELIESTYFSCSGGKTEDAVAVWGTNVPYLRAVDSPGEEKCRHYEDLSAFSLDEFMIRLGFLQKRDISNDDLSVKYTSGGGVESIKVLDKTYSGVEMRNLLELKSTVFSIDIDNGMVRITTRGNGHRVGMSQYGAEAMAVEGSDYIEILKHYYTGAELEILTSQQMNTIFDKGINL